jgi:serine/threonine protein phosphatase PrpC
MTTCPACGAERAPDASFCEGCGHDFTGGTAPTAAATDPEAQPRQAPARAQTAVEGEESPLDVGWTGAVTRDPAVPIGGSADPVCPSCGTGHFLDGYCDTCGSKAPNPRDHYTEAPAPWVGGACDIGRRHTRNEDAMALGAAGAPLEAAVLVVCDGVSNSTDSHLASLAAARAARDVLDDPVPRGMGLRDAVVGAMLAQLAAAVVAARAAVIATTKDVTVPNPPSCTFVAALVDHGLAVVGNVGDSRAYWLPDAPGSAPVQLTTDDSYAAEQIREGMPRKEAETGAQAHAITRWVGVDSPDDIAPHTTHLDLTEDGWLLVATDGLWNYCSDAADLRALLATTVAGLGDAGLNPVALAQGLVAYANAQGGADNITAALLRVGATAPEPPPAPPPSLVVPTSPDQTSSSTAASSAPSASADKDSIDGTVHD